jgi:hypothetical protein
MVSSSGHCNRTPGSLKLFAELAGKKVTCNTARFALENPKWRKGFTKGI